MPEMIDVLNRLKEIAATKPELVRDAVENVEKTNPKEVKENAVESEVAIKTDERELTGSEEAKKEKFVKSMKKDKEGFEKRYGDDADSVMYATATKMAKKEDEAYFSEGGMSDIHIGAQEVVGEFINDDGNLTMRKAEVLGAMDKAKANAPFPRSYEIETAMRMVQDDFNDNGSRKHEIDEPEGIDGLGDSEQLNTNTMKTEDKKPVNEAIQMSADSPEEAGLLMQILQMAGIKPMGAEMPTQEPNADHDHDGDGVQDHTPQDCPSDETDGDEMARYKQMVTAPDEEKQEETFDNEPDEKVQDVDSLVNVHSGGLNKQKIQKRKEYPGDNPMAAEDKITEQELANSLRTQYDNFKAQYQAEAKKAKPDFLDMDKDGNKKEPMKKAVDDKKAK